MGTCSWVCCTGRMEGSVLMVYVPGMLPMLLKELGKAHFKVTISWATAAEWESIAVLGFGGLRDDLGFVEGGAGFLALRAGSGSVILGEGLLWCVQLMTWVTKSLNWMEFVLVLLRPLWRGNCHGKGVQCGWSRSIRGSWKVTLLAVFLMLPGLEVVWTVRASMCDNAVRLGTLNSRIPGHSDVVQDNRIWGM